LPTGGAPLGEQRLLVDPGAGRVSRGQPRGRGFGLECAALERPVAPPPRVAVGTFEGLPPDPSRASLLRRAGRTNGVASPGDRYIRMASAGQRLPPGAAIAPALTEAGEPWLHRGLESSLTVSESPPSATLSGNHRFVGDLHLGVHGRSRASAGGGVSGIRPCGRSQGASGRSRYQRDHPRPGPGLHRRLHAPPDQLI